MWNMQRQGCRSILSTRQRTSAFVTVSRAKRANPRCVAKPRIYEEESFRQVMMRAHDMLVILGADGTMRYQSPAAEQILGYAAKDTLGISGFNFVHPDDRAHLLTTFAELLTQPGSSCSATMRVLHHNGSWRTVESVATNLLQDATVAGIVINCRDVTELENAKKTLHDVYAQSERRIAELKHVLAAQCQNVSDVTHELKSPLSIMRASLEVASVHPAQTDWRTLVSEVLEEITYMQRLIDEIYELAYLDELGGETDIGRRRKVDLSTLVTVESHALSDQRIRTDEVSWAWVRGNPDHFKRIIRNLLDNATRYARNTIVLSLATNQQHAILAVEDDGPGIPASDHERIFQRFSRGKRQRGQTQEGPGLGLAIVRRLVLQYGGEITVSDSPLGGAKFVVTLPAARE